MPHFTTWVQQVLDVDLDSRVKPQEMPINYPQPILSQEFLEAIKKSNFDYSTEGIDRMIRAHGHTLREIFTLRHGNFKKIPDIVVWPSKLNFTKLIIFFLRLRKVV